MVSDSAEECDKGWLDNCVVFPNLILPKVKKIVNFIVSLLIDFSLVADMEV